jgi:hypothetical protein
MSPGTLSVLPTNLTTGEAQPVATVMDFAPMVNIGVFGMCRSVANPQVAAATAAASGVLTPQPCAPVTTAPWSPGAPAVTVQGLKALTEDSQCQCAWAGAIEIVSPAAQKVTAG